MAKNNPSTERADTRPREGQTAIGMYIDDSLADRLAAYIERTRPRPSKTSVVEAALEAFLDAAEGQK